MSAVDLQLNESVSFTEAVYMEPFPNQFNWTFEGASNGVSNDENPSGITYNQVGEHNVTLEITDVCGYTESRTFTDTIKVDAPTGVDDINASSLTVFPTILNNGNEFHINDKANNEIVNVIVTGLNGKVVKSFYNNGLLSIGDEVVSGTYIVSIYQKEGRSNLKVLINR